MTASSRREHRDLLVRARAALETPDDLDGLDRSALIDDLAAAEAAMTGFEPNTVAVALVDSGTDTRFYAATSDIGLERELAEWCRPRWDRTDDPHDPDTLDDGEIVRRYFAGDISEYFAIGTTHVARDTPAIEQGRYCVLSTAHLSVATADRLERWSPGSAAPPPLAVASNFYGWFVSTLEVESLTETLPEDLLAVLRFGRDRGFDHILFDCDAGCAEGLAVHQW